MDMNDVPRKIIKVREYKHSMGKIFGATLEARPSWLSFYLNILKDRNTIVNNKDDADKHIGGPASVFKCEKKMLLYLQKAHTYTILYLLKKEIGEIFMKADSKKHETQKLVSIIKVVEKSSRYLFYLW